MFDDGKARRRGRSIQIHHSCLGHNGNSYFRNDAEVSIIYRLQKKNESCIAPRMITLVKPHCNPMDLNHACLYNALVTLNQVNDQQTNLNNCN